MITSIEDIYFFNYNIIRICQQTRVDRYSGPSQLIHKQVDDVSDDKIMLQSRASHWAYLAVKTFAFCLILAVKKVPQT